MQIFITCFLIVSMLASCSETKIYLVRHAEKGTTPSLQDPDLTDSGRQRAVDLANLLKRKSIQTIYSTHFRRTIQTATPLKDSLNQTIHFYATDTLGKFIVKTVGIRSNALVVSHSNKILPMLDTLHLHHTISLIPENDFDNLFIITVKRRWFSRVRLSLFETTYGVSSPF
jgi:phosphohistidine phosphatase SixA